MLIEFDEFGGVSGRPCSLAEMAIPALAIVFAWRHATPIGILTDMSDIETC